MQWLALISGGLPYVHEHVSVCMLILACERDGIHNFNPVVFHFCLCDYGCKNKILGYF